MEKYFIHLNGYGQKNGPVRIDKIIKVPYQDFYKYQAANTRKKYIQRQIDYHYPGLKSHNIVLVRCFTKKI